MATSNQKCKLGKVDYYVCINKCYWNDRLVEVGQFVLAPKSAITSRCFERASEFPKQYYTYEPKEEVASEPTKEATPKEDVVEGKVEATDGV